MPDLRERLQAALGAAYRLEAELSGGAMSRVVMPTNAKMPQLKKAFEAAGFTDVKTLLSSGNVANGSSRSCGNGRPRP